MAASAQVNLQGTIIGLPSGGKTLSASVVSAAANGTVTDIVLAAGNNTITVPTTPACTGCYIQLNTANTSIVTYKGIAGDTGTAIGKTGWMVLNWDPTAPPASFVLNSVATQTGLITEITFW